jgi:hypothetical protein
VKITTLSLEITRPSQGRHSPVTALVQALAVARALGDKTGGGQGYPTVN